MNNQSFVQRLKHVPFSVLPEDLQMDMFFCISCYAGSSYDSAARSEKRISVDIVSSHRSCPLVHGLRKCAAATCWLEQIL